MVWAGINLSTHTNSQAIQHITDALRAHSSQLRERVFQEQQRANALEIERDALQSQVQRREREILRIQTHEIAAAHLLDQQLSPEDRARFKELADENAQLRERVEALESDPRMQCPLDGPGSHRADLMELRRLQAGKNTDTTAQDV